MPTEMDAVDAADLVALKEGEDSALNRVMERHREKIFHYLVRLLQNESEALDLAQETFVRIYLNRNKFDPRHRFSSWMYSIATNLARDRLRWLARHQNLSLDAAAGATDVSLAERLPEEKLPPDESLLRDERVLEIREALARLPEDLRTPLILAEYQDMSQAEISEVLGCTLKAVENRLYRGRKLLRDRLTHLF